jgi:putative DNA primase/helicase
MTTPVARLLSLLKAVKKKGNGWSARCPAHDDRRPSLSVSEGDDGRALVKCFAGCAAEAIAGAVGLTVRDLMPERESTRQPRRKSPPIARKFDTPNAALAQLERQLGKRSAVWTYEDADGNSVGLVVRWDLPDGGKDFRPARRDPDGWRIGAMAEPRTLYGLPDLAAVKRVVVAEGEKAVEAARRLGLIATTSPGGSQAAKQADWRPLAGKEVWILPDNDAPGRKYAETVAEILLGLQPRPSVKLVNLPDLPEGGDIVEWITSRGEPSDPTELRLMLEDLANRAPEVKGDSEAAEADDVATIEDLIRFGASVRWLWPGWIQIGVLVIIAAEGGAGKTRFCADLLRRIRHSLAWPDGKKIEVDPASLVLWVVADNHHDEMVTLSQDFGIVESIRLNASKKDPYGGVSLESPEELAQLERRIRAVKPILVIIDTVGNSTDKNLSKQEDAKAYYQPLQVMARKTGTAIVCLTHLSANGNVLGRRAQEKVRVVIQMSQPDPSSEKRKLWVHKTNAQKPKPMGLTMGNKGNEYDDNPPEAPATEGEFKETGIDLAVEWLTGKLHEADDSRKVGELITLAEADGINRNTLYRAQKRLVKNGEVREDEKGKEGGKRGYKVWTLTSPAAS